MFPEARTTDLIQDILAVGNEAFQRGWFPYLPHVILVPEYRDRGEWLANIS